MNIVATITGHLRKLALNPDTIGNARENLSANLTLRYVGAVMDLPSYSMELVIDLEGVQNHVRLPFTKGMALPSSVMVAGTHSMQIIWTSTMSDVVYRSTIAKYTILPSIV